MFAAAVRLKPMGADRLGGRAGQGARAQPFPLRGGSAPVPRRGWRRAAASSGHRQRTDAGYRRLSHYGTLSSRTFTYKGLSFALNSIYSTDSFTYVEFFSHSSVGNAQQIFLTPDR